MSASAPWTAPVADTADCDAAAANGPENTGQFFKHRDLPEKKEEKNANAANTSSSAQDWNVALARKYASTGYNM